MELLYLAEILLEPQVHQALPPLAIAAIVAAASTATKAAGKIAGQAKVKNEAKNRLAELGDQKDAMLGQFDDITSGITTGYEDYLANISSLSDLNIDRSFADAAVEASRDRMIGAGGGRVAGEELLREEARRTTANQVEAARAAAGDGAGLLGAISLAGMAEAGRMRDIDIQSQGQRERQLLAAQESFERGLITRAEFERLSQEAEQEANVSNELLFAQGGLSLAERVGELGFDRMNLESNYDQAIARQRAGLAQARANMIQGGFDLFGDAGLAFADMKAGGSLKKIKFNTG